MVIKVSKLKELFEMLILIVILIMATLVGFNNESLNIPLYLLEIAFLLYYFIVGRGLCILRNGKGLLLFAVFILIPTLVSMIGDFSLQLLWRTLRISITPILGFIFGTYSSQDTRIKLYRVIYFLVLVSIVYAFYEYSIGAAYGYNSRMDSFFGHPIVYGSVLLCAFWMSFYIIKSNSIRIIFVGIICLGVITSGARSAWVALGVSIVVYFLLRRHSKSMRVKKKDFILGGGIIAAVIIFLVLSGLLAQAVEYVNSRFSGVIGSVSATQRLGSIGYILSEFFFHSNLFAIIFGHGTGNAGDLISQTVISISNFTTTDNQYITLLYDYGIIGFIFVILLIKDVIITIRKADFRSEKQIIATVILCGGLFTAFFYELLGWLSISTLILLFIGIFYSIRNVKSEDSR